MVPDSGGSPRGIAGWRPTTWRTKLLLLLLAFAIAPLAVQAVWDYLAMRRAFERATLEAMAGLARAKAQALEQLTTDRRLQVERIAGLLASRVRAVEALATSGLLPPQPDASSLPDLADAEALPPRAEGEPATPPPAGAGPGERTQSSSLLELREALALLLWDQRQFEELLVIDPAGRVIASTFEGHEGRDASGLDYFRNGLRTTFVQPVFLSPITDQLTMVISTPVRDPSHGVVGVLAARLNLARLFAVISDATGLAETGETTVAKRESDRIVFTAPTRHDPEAALRRTLPLDSPLAAALAVRQEEGSAAVRDYRGEEVLAGWAAVPALEWGLVVKQDRAEALEPATRAGLRMLALIVPLLLGVVVVSLLASRALVQPLAALRSAADRISRGDLDVQLDIPSRDEIGQLADSFERMVAAIRFFRERREVEDDEALYEEEPVEPGPR